MSLRTFKWENAINATTNSNIRVHPPSYGGHWTTPFAHENSGKYSEDVLRMSINYNRSVLNKRIIKMKTDDIQVSWWGFHDMVTIVTISYHGGESTKYMPNMIARSDCARAPNWSETFFTTCHRHQKIEAQLSTETCAEQRSVKVLKYTTSVFVVPMTTSN